MSDEPMLNEPVTPRFNEKAFVVAVGCSANTIADELIAFYGVAGAQRIRVCLGMKLKGRSYVIEDPFGDKDPIVKQIR